jgi:hypothetical protein
MPAVKYSAVGVTFSDPVGKRSPQRSGIVMGRPDGSRSWPAGSPLTALNVSMRPPAEVADQDVASGGAEGRGG